MRKQGPRNWILPTTWMSEKPASPGDSRREHSLPTPWFYPGETCVRLLTYRTVRLWICVVLSPEFVIICSGSNRKLIQLRTWNAHFQSLPQTYWIRNWRGGVFAVEFNKLPMWFWWAEIWAPLLDMNRPPKMLSRYMTTQTKTMFPPSIVGGFAHVTKFLPNTLCSKGWLQQVWGVKMVHMPKKRLAGTDPGR